MLYYLQCLPSKLQVTDNIQNRYGITDGHVLLLYDLSLIIYLGRIPGTLTYIVLVA